MSFVVKLLASVTALAAISGSVKDQDGQPIDHLSVQVFDQNGQLTRATFTASDGTYTADRLIQGNLYDVAVASISQELARTVGVRGGEKNVNLKVPLKSLSGQVVRNGKPVVGATVSASSIDWALDRTATTDKDGRFRLTQLPPTIYEVAADAPGQQRKVISVDISKRDVTPVIAFDSAAAVEVLVLEKTTKMPLQCVDVSIGENIAGVLKLRHIGRTGPDGKVSDANVVPGSIALYAASPLHQEDPVRISVQPGQKVTATLYADRSAKLFGDVTSYVNQATAPLKKATIMAEPLSPLPKGDVGSYGGVYNNGKFSILVPPGRYRVHVILEFAKTDRSLMNPARSIILTSGDVNVTRGTAASVTLKPSR